MSDIQSNVSLGREVELYGRVVDDDPTDCGLVMLVLRDLTLPTDAQLKDYDTVAALFAGGADEVTNSGYAREVFLSADLSPYVVDDANNAIILTLPAVTFPSIGIGDLWRKVVIAFDPDTTGGTNTELIPITYHDLFEPDSTSVPLTPNGFNLEIDFSAGVVVAT